MKTMRMSFPFETKPVPPCRELSAEERAGLREAEDDIRAGRVVSFDDVKAWVELWDTPNELPAPHDRWR